jgi:predicted ATPase
VEGRRHLRKGLDELAQGVPESLRQMLAQQLERLSVEEQRVLEAASVAGVEFSAAAVAAGLDTDVVVAETRCEGLARRQQWLRSIGIDEWPDGTVAGRYAFIHALYHHVVYHHVTAARHVHLHRRIGASKEVAFGPRAGEIAAELAVHFEHGRDARRAAQYLQQAGENAIRRCANQEAIRLLTKGLELLITLPDTPERSQQELVLQTTLGPALMVTKGWAASEVKHIYARARELCWQVGETPHLFAALHGLSLFYLVRAELQTARELGEQLLALAQRMQDPSLLLEACWVLGDVLFFLGEFAPARDLAEQGLSLYEPQQHRALAFHYGGSDSGVGCGILLAWALWYLGYPEQALQRSQAAITLAQELAHPYSLVYALNYVGRLHQCRGEGQAAQQRAEAAIALCTEQGFGLYLAMGAILRGWALAAQGQGMEGIVQMHQGLAALRATGGEITRPYWLALLAEAYGKGGQAEEEFAVLTEALAAVDKSGERFYEAELHRLKGELMLSAHNEAEVEACFQQALAIARHQQTKSLELRAAMSLSRLWQQQGKHDEAYDLLAPLYGWFTEGFDTADLQEAKALLEELS